MKQKKWAFVPGWPEFQATRNGDIKRRGKIIRPYKVSIQLSRKEYIVQKEKGLWNTKQVADYLDVTEATIRYRIKKCGFPYIKILRGYRFKKSEVDKWVDKNTTRVTA